MLIPAKHLERYWGLHPETILHVGAHEAEELADYQAASWGNSQVIWVEALPAKVESLRERLGALANHRVIQALAWSKTGESISLIETTNTQSSSVLALGEHARLYPEIKPGKTHELKTVSLGESPEILSLPRIDLVNLDVQGAELEVLRGLSAVMDRIAAVYSEVNLIEIYQGNPLISDIDGYLTGQGFKLVDVELLPDGWGDALWLRAEDPHLRIRGFRSFSRKINQRVENVLKDLKSRVV